MPTRIRLAIDGFGIAAVPAGVVQNELAHGELATVRVAKPFPPLPLVASYHPGPGSLASERVADIARATVREFCAETDPELAWV